MELLSHGWGHAAVLTPPQTMAGDVSASRNLTHSFAKSDVAAELQVPKKYLDCLNIYIVKVSFDVSFTLVFVICCKLVAAVLRRPRIKESKGFQQRLGRNSRLKLLTACCGYMRT